MNRLYHIMEQGANQERKIIIMKKFNSYYWLEKKELDKLLRNSLVFLVSISQFFLD